MGGLQQLAQAVVPAEGEVWGDSRTRLGPAVCRAGRGDEIEQAGEDTGRGGGGAAQAVDKDGALRGHPTLGGRVAPGRVGWETVGEGAPGY